MRFPSELPIRPRHHPARLRPASANAVSRTSLSFFLFSTDLTDAPVHLHARNPDIMRTLAFRESSAWRTLSLLRFTDTGSQRYPIVRRIRALWAKCGTRDGQGCRSYGTHLEVLCWAAGYGRRNPLRHHNICAGSSTSFLLHLAARRGSILEALMGLGDLSCGNLISVVLCLCAESLLKSLFQG